MCIICARQICARSCHTNFAYHAPRFVPSCWEVLSEFCPHHLCGCAKCCPIYQKCCVHRISRDAILCLQLQVFCLQLSFCAYSCLRELFCSQLEVFCLQLKLTTEACLLTVGVFVLSTSTDCKQNNSTGRLKRFPQFRALFFWLSECVLQGVSFRVCPCESVLLKTLSEKIDNPQPPYLMYARILKDGINWGVIWRKNTLPFCRMKGSSLKNGTRIRPNVAYKPPLFYAIWTDFIRDRVVFKKLKRALDALPLFAHYYPCDTHTHTEDESNRDELLATLCSSLQCQAWARLQATGGTWRQCTLMAGWHEFRPPSHPNDHIPFQRKLLHVLWCTPREQIIIKFID